MVAEHGGQVQVVQRGDDGNSRLGQPPDQGKNVELHVDAEVVSRLVEHRRRTLRGPALFLVQLLVIRTADARSPSYYLMGAALTLITLFTIRKYAKTGEALA
ncbi:hypothetical protein ACFQ36_01810 [Arthrobacter sp. GCM10027362]|uniref:hypothetical protein n=1 Tax=Arthrobacter sp. GCM10027362 TaxID=3273379 RepID=UPI003640B8DD